MEGNLVKNIWLDGMVFEVFFDFEIFLFQNGSCEGQIVEWEGRIQKLQGQIFVYDVGYYGGRQIFGYILLEWREDLIQEKIEQICN